MPTHTRQGFAGAVTVKIRTAAGGVIAIPVDKAGAVELEAGSVLEVYDGTSVCAMVVCPGRFPDTAAESTDLSVAEKLAVCASFPFFFFF